MSKKKSMTMTLRDFHGGSIPPQLPLPSAPASTVAGSSWPPDRPAAAWGAAAASASIRPDHQLLRPRHGSAGAGYASPSSLDEGHPAFLPNPSRIGRHFDEDERKPFDASAPPRALATPDTALRLHPPLSTSSRSEPKRPISSPLVLSPAAAVPGPSAVHPSPSTSISSAPNAWGLRKEAATEPPSPLPVQLTPTAWSASRLAQASAVEKVSSGLWQSKPHEVGSIRSHESTQGSRRRSAESLRVVEDANGDHEREKPRLTSPMVVAYGKVKERTSTEISPGQGLVRSPMYSEPKEGNVFGCPMEGTRPESSDGGSERSKLNLLPRTKPIDSPDIQNRELDDKMVNVHETRGSINPLQSVGRDDGTRAVERPKLHLMPRTKAIQQPDGNAAKGSPTVFGGARPREMVLKERGVNVTARDLDVIKPPARGRARNDISSSDWKMDHQLGERADGVPAGQKRTGKDHERKGYQPDAEKLDFQRTSSMNENQKNTRGSDRVLEQSRADSGTWRKPIEQLKTDNPAPQIGKASSPLELARAFSGPGSVAGIANQKSVPGQIQVPFSRLTEVRPDPSQRQINGHS